MKTRIALETDFVQLLAKLIGEGGDDDDPPIERTGKHLTCSQPVLGRWIDDCDFPFLMETLALPDRVFEQEFPEIKLSHNDRETFAKVLTTHCKECARCNAKQTEDIAWRIRIEKAIAKNKEAIGAALANEPRKP